MNTKNTNSNKTTGLSKKILKYTLKILGGIFSVLFTFFIIFALTGLIVGSVFANYCKNYLAEDYDIPNIKLELEMTTSIFAKDKTTGQYYELEDQRLHGSENRIWASISQMPENLQKAFIAIEDERFYEHSGVDWRRTIGATLEFVQGNDSYGGSTITQQLIKNVTEYDDTTIQRKVQEIFRAISLTKKRSKDEVLEMYLNTINLSRGNRGVQSAANYYFGKEVSDLTLVECAALAAIPKSPTKYDPVRNPENNKERRALVLNKMHELKWITEKERDEAITADLVLNITTELGTSSTYSYYTDAIIEQLITDLSEKYGYTREISSSMVFGGGLQVYSCVDPDIQNAMERIFEDPNTISQGKGSSIDPQAAMVVIDPHTGDVVGLVGGLGEKKLNRELNRATFSTRQIGSSIKPISVYAPAIDLGVINCATPLVDEPFKFDTSMGRDWPKNSPNKYEGNISLNYAVSKSKNTIAVKVCDMITPEYSYDFLTNKLGVSTLVDRDKNLASLALGGLTYGMTVMDVTAAYGIFPSGGIYSKPRLYEKVLDSEGNEILVNDPQRSAVISESTSQIMTKLLQNVVTSGTGASVTLKNKVNTAGKTGTTSDNKDKYFAGFTPYYVAACWFGADIPIYLGSRFPGNPALNIWDKVMNEIHKDIVSEGNLKKFDFSSTVTASFCPVSGDKPGPFCTTEDGIFSKGTQPTKLCTGHGSGIDWDSFLPPLDFSSPDFSDSQTSEEDNSPINDTNENNLLSVLNNNVLVENNYEAY